MVLKLHEGQELRRKDKHNIKVRINRIVHTGVYCMCGDGYERRFNKQALKKHYEEIPKDGDRVR